MNTFPEINVITLYSLTLACLASGDFSALADQGTYFSWFSRAHIFMCLFRLEYEEVVVKLALQKGHRVDLALCGGIVFLVVELQGGSSSVDSSED